MRKNGTWLLLAAGTLGLVLSFQNCAPQDLTGGVDPESQAGPIVPEDYDPALDALSFPYKLTYSQFGFSSCTARGPVGPGSFNYMFTTQNVFDNPNVPPAGLEVRDEFISELGRTPGGATIDNFRKAIRFSKNAKGYTPILALTMPSNGAQVTLVNDQPAFEKLFSSPLSEPGYAERIVFDKGNGVYSYFTPLPNFGISPSERAVVSRLKLQLNNASGGFFSSLTSSTTLASVFGKEGGATYPDIANVGDGSGRVYGTGYTLNFDRALASASTSVYGVRNVVSSISEKDLLTGLNSSANWTCPASFRMKVVKAEDRFKMAHFRLNNVEGVPKTICPHQPLSGLYLPNGQPDPVAFAKLRIIERVLPQSDWDINVTDNCVVPRNPSCYEDESDTVVYDESFFTTTDTTAVPPRYSGCNVGTQFDCPHYVTICYRTDL